MNWFRSKKQVDEIKSVPLLEHSIDVKTNLKLARLRIEFSTSQRNEYQAWVEYKEKPTQWSTEDNQSKEVQLTAESWPELIDKVVAHFSSQIVPASEIQAHELEHES